MSKTRKKGIDLEDVEKKFKKMEKGLLLLDEIWFVGLNSAVSHLDAFLTAKIRAETLDGYIDLQ